MRDVLRTLTFLRFHAASPTLFVIAAETCLDRKFPLPTLNPVGLLAASLPGNHIPGANLALGGGKQLKLVPTVPGTLTLCSYISCPIGSEDR